MRIASPWVTCALLGGAGCMVGGGPQLAIGRRGPSFGVQGGVGFGGQSETGSGGMRFDVGLVQGKRRYGFAAFTVLFHRHDTTESERTGGDGGSFSIGGGGGSGLLLAGGIHGGSFSNSGCSRGDNWFLGFGVRYAADELEAVLWPQYTRWTAMCF